MTQEDTQVQEATERLIATNDSIARHDFDPKFYVDDKLICMVVRN